MEPVYVKCENCAYLDKEKFPRHAETGFGQCKLNREPGKFYSMVFEHQCEHYKGKETQEK
jgi:hypothetical protein